MDSELACAHCGRAFQVRPTGRPRKYCKPSCRVAACEKRRPRPPKAARVPFADQVAMRVWEAMQAAKIVPSGQPLPPCKADAS